MTQFFLYKLILLYASSSSSLIDVLDFDSSAHIKIKLVSCFCQLFSVVIFR